MQLDMLSHGGFTTSEKQYTHTQNVHASSHTHTHARAHTHTNTHTQAKRTLCAILFFTSSF